MSGQGQDGNPVCRGQGQGRVKTGAAKGRDRLRREEAKSESQRGSVTKGCGINGMNRVGVLVEEYRCD